MPSPFPGMDPYIEQSKIWVDFHNRLADEMSAQLNAQIRPAYFARLTPYTTYEVVEISHTRLRAIRPDVGVMRRDAPTQSGTSEAILEATPVESAVELDGPLELLTVEIYHTDDEVLVTAIEILSPVNKQPGHQAYTDYLRKRRELLRSTAHLLEIDLLRGGSRPPLTMTVPQAPYYITLSRVERRPFVSVWPIQLKTTLPSIPIPLQAPDPDASLNLNEVVAAVYERGGYDVQIDYSQPVPPPVLSAEEAAWVGQLITQYR